MNLLKDKVYSLCRKIPKGKVSTYKEIADRLGVKAYRTVGQILKRNPYAPEVPCHRVISSSGKLGGFRGTQTSEKVKLLKKEGVTIVNGKIDLEKYLFKFS